MTETKKKYKRVDHNIEHYPGLGECHILGESLKDGNLIVRAGNGRRYVVDESGWCRKCGAIYFRSYNKSLDGV